jgi:hypothetical protein
MAIKLQMNIGRCCSWMAALTGRDGKDGGFTREELAWQDRACAGRTPALVVRSATRMDVGHWLGKAPLCVAVVADELVLFAPGKRPFIARVPIVQLSESQYNHVTGELLLAPAPSALVRRLNVPPVEGRKLLEAIQGKGN